MFLLIYNLSKLYTPHYFERFRPKNRVIKVAKATTEMELIGIRRAATTGDKCPDKAKAIPITL